jgi:alkylated DNA nucleotide flippase Atl1
MSDDSRADQVVRRLRAVPAGFVATYGDLFPEAPRFAGRVLAQCDDPDVPWHRIVRADGSLAKGSRQRRLLDSEGIPFRGDRVEMDIARIYAEGLDELVRG